MKWAGNEHFRRFYVLARRVHAICDMKTLGGQPNGSLPFWMPNSRRGSDVAATRKNRAEDFDTQEIRLERAAHSF